MLTFWKLKPAYRDRDFYLFQNGVQPWIMFPTEHECCVLEGICTKEIVDDRGNDITVSE